MKTEENHSPQSDGEFFLRYLDNGLPEEETAGLNRRLETDKAFRRRFAELLMQTVHLSEIAKEDEEAAESHHRGRMHRRSRKLVPGGYKRRGLPWQWVAAVAAAVVVGFILYFALQWRGPEVEEKTVVVKKKDIPAPEPEKTPAIVKKPVVVDKRPEVKEPEPEVVEKTPAGTPEVVEETPEPEPVPKKEPKPEVVDKPEKKPAPAEKIETKVKKLVVAVDTVVRKPKVKRKDGKKWNVLKKGDTLSTGDLLKTGSRDKVIVLLSDNSTIIINSGTEVAISNYVELKKGEIYVRAMPQAEKTAFEFVTPSATIRAKGTEFNLMHKSGRTTLTVIEGEVECASDKGSVDVKKGFQTKVSSNGKPSKPKKLSQKKLEKVTAWTRKLFLLPEPIADAKPPVGFGYYEGCGRAVWGRTAVTSHSGRYSAFLKGAAYEKAEGKNTLNVALVIGNSDGYRGKNAFKTEPNTRYSFSLWVKGNFRNTMYVCLTEWQTDTALKNDRVTSNNNVASFIPSARWTLIKGSFTTHRKAKKFIVHLQAKGSSKKMNLGVLYVDDVVIKKQGSKKNIVENSGLEM
jgi:ferric-dicitrate binding protein FerR (iron transport regulator)